MDTQTRRRGLWTIGAAALVAFVMAAWPVGVMVQGAWTLPLNTNGSMRIWGKTADTLCIGSTLLSPSATTDCIGGIYAGTLKLAGSSVHPRSTTTSSSTGTLNDFAPTLTGDTDIYMANATDATITGLTAGTYDGQQVTFWPTSTGNVILTNEGAGSAAANRFALSSGQSQTYAAGSLYPGRITVYYLSGANRWYERLSAQGAYLTYATTYGGGGAIGNGDASMIYKLQDRTVHYQLRFQAGTTTTFSTTMTFTLPFAFGATGTEFSFYAIDNSAAKLYHGFAVSDGTGSTITLYVDAGTAGGELSLVSSTVPFTWATSDRLYISGVYSTQ